MDSIVSVYLASSAVICSTTRVCSRGATSGWMTQKPSRQNAWTCASLSKLLWVAIARGA